MSAETREFTPQQQTYQRLLLRDGASEPGDGLKRLGLNTAIFLGATATDLAESNLAELLRGKLDKRAETSYEAYEAAQNTVGAERKTNTEIEHLFDVAYTKRGHAWASDIFEEWASDSLYTGVANKLAQKATGLDDVKYVSESAAFIGDWGNIISQVFLHDPKFGWMEHGEPKKLGPIKLAYKSYDFFNAVNVEAGIRMLEELSVPGKGVKWAHEKLDALLETPVGSKLNNSFVKLAIGFHMGRNIKGLQRIPVPVKDPTPLV